MKKTVRNAVLAAMVLTTVCGGTQMVSATGQVNAGSGVVTKDLSNISVDDVIYSVIAYDKGTLNADTEEINIKNSYFNADNSDAVNYAIIAQNSGKINLGDSNKTKTINVSAEGTNPTGLFACYHEGAQIKIAGENFNVNVHGVDSATGIRAQSNIPTPDKSPIPAVIDIDAKNTVINATTDKDVVDAGEHNAIGIIAYSGSVININNNLTVNAATAISTRGNSTININKDGTGTVKLNGDISFNYNKPTSGTTIDSTVNLNLTNAESYFNGNIVKTGNPPSDKITVHDMDMSLSNGATWTSTADSFVNNLTLKNGGTVNLAGDAHSVEVLDSTSSNNGAVATNSLDSKVKLEGTKNIKSLTVKGTGAMADAIAKDPSVADKLAKVVEDETGKSAATNVTTDEGEVAGAYNGTVSADGTVSGSIAKNTTNENISGLGVISLMTWRQENNDLNKRLGELRDSKGQYGLWTRMSRGEAKYNDLGIKNQYNYYQLGYDAKVSDNWILGGAVSYTDGESSFCDGDGTNKHTGFAVYGSRLGDDGSFIDVIAKYAHMKNEYDTYTYAGAGDGDYSTNGFAFSAEYGKRFKGENNFWIEPQAELTYGRVDSANFTTAKGVHVHQDSLDSLVGRLGFALGKDIKAGHVYVRASYLYDFKGDVNMYMDKNGVSDSYDHDLGGGWWEFGVGTNLNLGHDTHFYFDVERTASGEVSTPWQWNAGIRYSF